MESWNESASSYKAWFKEQSKSELTRKSISDFCIGYFPVSRLEKIVPMKCFDLSCPSSLNITLDSCECVLVAVFSATLISPLELIRTKLQSERQSYRELSAVIRSAVHTEGWLALWRGLGPTLLRDVPFSGKTKQNWETDLQDIFPFRLHKCRLVWGLNSSVFHPAFRTTDLHG